MKLTFKKGLPGFENLKKFDLTNIEENANYKMLQSVESEISFVTTDPFEIYSEYEINLSEEVIKELEIKEPSDVLVLSIITLGKTLQQSTINLKAPIVINMKNNLAKQYILQSENYDTKHPLTRREQNVSSY